MESTGDRIHKVRIDNGLNQTEFGKRINISQNHVSNLEKGSRPITESLIRVIGYEYNINPNWLRTGQGNSSNENTLLDQISEKYSLSESDRKFIDGYITLNRDERNSILKFVNAVSDK